MADLIIKDMEMPEDGVYWCEIGIAGEIATMTIHGEDRKSFPLIPLPAGHGKIIDADKLWENMTVEQSEAFQKGLASDIELFEILEATEAIVPEEDKNG